VYLAGTITRDDRHLSWREDAETKLAQAGILAVSPVRGKDPQDWRPDGLDSENTVYSRGGFVSRDERDIVRADAILLCFLAAQCPRRQSIGTWSEFGFAHGLNVSRGWPVPVVVVSDMPEVTEHPFIQQWSARVERTLDAGIAYLVFLLGG
jgi:nucleoside 2-deoxyribosyltransferase